MKSALTVSDLIKAIAMHFILLFPSYFTHNIYYSCTRPHHNSLMQVFLFTF